MQTTHESIRRLYFGLADKKPDNLYVKIAFGSPKPETILRSKRPIVARVFVARYRLRQQVVQIAAISYYGSLERADVVTKYAEFGRATPLPAEAIAIFDTLLLAAPRESLLTPLKPVQVVQVNGDVASYLGSRHPAVSKILGHFRIAYKAEQNTSRVRAFLLEHMHAFRSHDSNGYQRPDEELL